jgi:Mg2+-importing ATPase
MLLWTTAGVTLLAFAIPYLPHAGLVGFVPLPPAVVAALVAVALLYVASAEWLKRGFYRREGSALTPPPEAHRPGAP